MSNPLLIGILIAAVMISVLWGLVRGLAKARIRGICVILCAVAAVAMAVASRQSIVTDTLITETLIPFIQEMDNTKIVIEALGISQTLNHALLHCVTSLITPVLCVVYFLLLSFITWFVFLIVTLICGASLRRHNAHCHLSPLRASIWGLIQGLVIVAVFMVPVAAYLEIAPTVLDGILEADVLKPEEEKTVQEILDENIDPVNDGVVKVYRNIGGGALCDLLTDFEINQKQVDFSEEVGSVTSFGCNILRLSRTKFENYGSTEAVVFVSIADSFEDSVLLPTIAGEIIYDASSKWIGGEKFLGVQKPTFGEMSGIFDPFFSKLLEVLKTDAHNSKALQDDIRTVSEMVGIFAENGVFGKLSDTDKLMSALSSNGVVNSLIAKLGENDSMKVLIPEITNMGMRAIATTLGIPTDVDAVYGDLMSSIAASVNYVKDRPEEERVAKLSADLSEAFDEAGMIDIDQSIIDCYAISMVKDLVSSDKEEITADDVQAFFEVYALNAGDEEQEGDASDPTEGVALVGNTDRFAGTVYEGKSEAELKACGAAVLADAHRLLANMEIGENESVSEVANGLLRSAYHELLTSDPTAWEALNNITVNEKLSEDSLKATASMQSSKNLMTKKVTLSDLLVDSEVAAQGINSDTIEKEADAIAAIFTAASNLQKEMNHNSDVDLKTVSGAVGNILDSLNRTASFGEEKTANLFTAVLQSETVRKSADMDMATATQMAQTATDSSKGELDYTKTMNAVSGSVDVFTKLGKDGEEVSEEELVELIKNINPQTAGMIEVYVTPARVESYKVSPKYAETSSELISSTFHYMADATMDDAQYEKEAKALNQALSIALSAKEHSAEQHLFTKEGQTGILPGNATETVETFMNSHALGYGLRTTMLDENGNVKEGKQDAFDLGEKLPENSTDRTECEEAIAAYYAANKTDENKLTLLALSALLGVDGAAILN